MKVATRSSAKLGCHLYIVLRVRVRPRRRIVPRPIAVVAGQNLVFPLISCAIVVAIHLQPASRYVSVSAKGAAAEDFVAGQVGRRMAEDKEQLLPGRMYVAP